MDQLAGKVVAITGGGTGIGAGIARGLAEAGCKVTVGGRRKEPLKALRAASRVSIRFKLKRSMYRIRKASHRFSLLYVIVMVTLIFWSTAPGINIQKRTMSDMDPADWDRVMQINASGAYRCMLEVLPTMRQRRDGLIVNISSVAGKRAISLGGVVYCASKFAMTALGTAVSNEVRNEGVRITNVYPGEVNTPILDNRPTPVSQEHKDSILQPEDIASVIVTICGLPPRANVPEIVIKPTTQEWV